MRTEIEALEAPCSVQANWFRWVT